MNLVSRRTGLLLLGGVAVIGGGLGVTLFHRPEPAAPPSRADAGVSVVDAGTVAIVDPGPRAETCNGRDDDRDGEFDEGCECATRFVSDRPGPWNAGISRIVRAGDDAFLAYGASGTLLRVDARGVRTLAKDLPPIVGTLTDADGSTLLVTDSGLVRVEARRTSPFVDPVPGRMRSIGAAGSFAQAVAIDAYGYSVRSESGWTTHPFPSPSTVAALGDGSVVVGGSSGDLTLVVEGLPRELPRLDAAPVTSIVGGSSSDFFVASGTRILHFDGTSFGLVLEDPVATRIALGLDAASELRVLTVSSTGSHLLRRSETGFETVASSEAPLVALLVDGDRILSTSELGDLVSFESGAETMVAPWSGASLSGVAFSSPDDVLVVGSHGRVFHHDGQRFTSVAVEAGAAKHFTSVVSVGEGRWIVGGGASLDGSRGAGFLEHCDRLRCRPGLPLRAIVRALARLPNGDLLIVGDDGLAEVLHDGRTVDLAPGQADYTAIAIDDANRIHVGYAALAGTAGGVRTWDGTTWTESFRTDEGAVLAVRANRQGELIVAGGRVSAVDGPRAFVLRGSGGRWTSVLSAADTLPIRSVFVEATGSVLFGRMNSTQRSFLARATSGRPENLVSLDGLGVGAIEGTDNHLFAVGEGGSVRHRCGAPVEPQVGDAGAPAGPPIATPTPTPTGVASNEPDPRARRAIAFVANQGDPHWEAYGVDAASRSPIALDLRANAGGRYDRREHGSVSPRLSSDGRTLAYYLRGRLRVRELETGHERILHGDPRGHDATSIVGFSADSRALLTFVVTEETDNYVLGLHRSVELATGRTYDHRLPEIGALPLALEDPTHLLVSIGDEWTAPLDLVRRSFGDRTSSRTLGRIGEGGTVWGATMSQGELAYASSFGVVVADREGAARQTVLPAEHGGTLGVPRFSPTNASIVVVRNGRDVEVYERAAARRSTRYACVSDGCTAAFLDETRVLVHDGTRLLVVDPAGVVKSLRERVAYVAFAGTD